MRVNSLALRLFVSATAVTVVILLITGVVLSSLYRDGVERSFDRRLGVYLRTLVADVAAPEEGEKVAQSLGEPLFELPLSGWYWQVTKLSAPKPEVRSSRSLWDAGLPHLEDLNVQTAPDGTRKRYVPGPEDQRLRLVERTVDLGDDGRYLVAVAGDALEIDDETQGFDRAIAVTFGVLAIVLLITTMFQVRFGLAPLKRISASLAAIRSGSAERLEGDFPVEIAPLARETNALIDANREIVERARTHVGNLAHALKTPLSVIMNEANARGDDPLAVKVREQANVMRDQVQRHLERARIAARADRGRHRHRRGAGGHRAGAHDGEDPSRPRHRDRHRGAARHALPRRAAGPRGDGRQPGRQCLQVGAVARRGRSAARSRRGGRRLDPARGGRRRRPRTDRHAARAGARRGAATGSTRPSPARGSGSRSWSISPRSTAAR